MDPPGGWTGVCQCLLGLQEPSRTNAKPTNADPGRRHRPEPAHDAGTITGGTDGADLDRGGPERAVGARAAARHPDHRRRGGGRRARGGGGRGGDRPCPRLRPRDRAPERRLGDLCPHHRGHPGEGRRDRLPTISARRLRLRRERGRALRPYRGAGPARPDRVGGVRSGLDHLPAPRRGAEPESGFLYQNPMADIREACASPAPTASARATPSTSRASPASARPSRRWSRARRCRSTASCSPTSSPGVFPPRPGYLDAHLALLAECAPGAPWMVAGLGVDILPLVPAAVARGGHVRVGLEDAPWGSERGNRAWVAAARRAIEAAGGTVAGVEAVRRDLARRTWQNRTWQSGIRRCGTAEAGALAATAGQADRASAGANRSRGPECPR